MFFLWCLVNFRFFTPIRLCFDDLFLEAGTDLSLVIDTNLLDVNDFLKVKALIWSLYLLPSLQLGQVRHSQIFMVTPNLLFWSIIGTRIASGFGSNDDWEAIVDHPKL